MDKIIKKITSRKFIVTAVIITAGIGTTLKSASNEKVQIAGIVIAGVAAIVYQAIEGSIDKASVESETKKIIDAVEGVELITQEIETED